MPDERDDVIDVLIPAGVHYIYLYYRADLNEEPKFAALDANGNFFASEYDAAEITITEGQTIDLGTIQ